MKRRWLHRIKRVLLPLLALGLLGASHLHQRSKQVKQVVLDLMNPEENGFVTAHDLRNLIGADTEIEGAPLGEVDLGRIERDLLHTQYVAQVQARIAPGGTVLCRLRLRKPVVRIQPLQAPPFYLDAGLNRMPASPTHNPGCLLVRGHVLDTASKLPLRQRPPASAVATLALAVAENPFLNAWLAEAYVLPDGQVELYPEWGPKRILLGHTEHVHDKLAALEALGQRLLQHPNPTYSELDARLPGQIAARRTVTP